MRRALCAIVGLALVGCGGSSPTAPTNPSTISPFQTGRYLVTLTGYDFSDDPSVPACAGSIGVPPAGKYVIVELLVVKEGAEWVGRSQAASGDLEMRFRDAGEALLGRRALSGTLRGNARDSGMPIVPLPPTDVSAVVAGNGPGGSAVLEGRTAFMSTANTLVGRATGDIQFRDAAGNTGRCSTVSVHINVLPR